MTDEAQLEKIMRQVQAMLDKAARSEFPAERDTFAAKAQELMTKYNLTSAAIERNTGKTTGKREEQKVRGGFYLWERSLWKSVTRLNFCWYWTQEVRVDFKYKGQTRWRFTKMHRLVGRQVNVAATIALCGHLKQSINRATMEYIHGDSGLFLSSNANAFREGMADVLVEKLSKKFKRKLKNEQDRMNGPARPKTGFSREVTLLSIQAQEEAGNYDFLYGEGAWAQKLQDEADEARAQAADEAAYTAWAAEHPEEAKAAEEERRKTRERFRSRRGDGGGIKYVDAHSYHSGRDAATKVSLDQQVDDGKSKTLIGHARGNL